MLVTLRYLTRLVSLPIGGEVISRRSPDSVLSYFSVGVSLPIGGEVISRLMTITSFLLLFFVSLPIGGEVISRRSR